MRQAIMVTGSLAATNGVLAALSPADADAAMVQENYPEILTHYVKYDGKKGAVAAYLARPVKAGKYPGIVAIHENAGLSNHIRDLARRLAKDGYVVLAPNYLSRLGGTRLVTPKGTGISNIRELVPWPIITEDTVSGFKYLKVLPDVRADKLGLIGFCWGGGMAFAAATQIPALDAVIVYYGRSPSPLDLVKNIRAPVFANYGEKDEGITKGVDATAAAMKKYSKIYDYKVFAGAGHAFNSDANPSRYNPQAAKEAWAHTLAFLNKNLKV